MDQNTFFESLVRWNFWGERKFPELRERDLMREIISYVEEPFPFHLKKS